MAKREEKPEYVQPIQLFQCEEGHVEVYKNWIGVGDSKWEPIERNDQTYG